MKTIPLFGIYRDAVIEAAALEVLRSGQIASGAYIERFSSGLGALLGNPNVVTMNDMSSAIQIALHLAGVKPGDEVLTAAYACMSTNAPIATSGGRAVWVDVDPCTGLIDPDALVRSITPRTKAAIVYHVAGYPAAAEEIAGICKGHGITLIEDCDNALLATINGKQVGSFGDFAVHSFYPNRQINATEGGALVCRRPEDAERAVRLRRYGIDLTRFRDRNGEINPACDIPEIGWAATLNNLCSAVGYTQLAGVAGRIQRSREVANKLQMDLVDIPEIAVVQPQFGSLPSYWSFLIRTNRRDEMLMQLKSRGVHVSKLHQRTDIYSGFGASYVELPGTTEFTRTVMGLPCGWWLEGEDIHYLVKMLRETIEMVGPARLSEI